ncbi:ABC transporter substrate-binding protein [Microbacterium arabinogalactanolyticum]|uniref:ABC transporter substrate-binding protein n=1 Tax=Microbacterium arabinogalactanolyticum TaxID=69365 RepID=UPI0040440C72
MTRKKRLAGLVALVGVSALLITGCSAKGDPGAGANVSEGMPQKGGTVHMLQKADFSNLDPARGWDTGVNAFYRLIYRGLVMRSAGDAKDPNLMVPDLAEKLGEVSDDGLTWTYTLKDDIFFDDGTPITSAEMKFGISRAWDPQIGIGSPYLKKTIDAPADYQGPYVSGDLPTIETPDAKTIVFHLKAPFPEFDNVLAQQNAVPFPLGSGGGDEFINHVVASGPYTLDKYTPGSIITLKRNEYWKPSSDDVRKAYPDAWQFDIGIDPATIDERLIAGQGEDANAISGRIQPATLPRLQTPQLKERIIKAPAVCATYIAMDTTKDVFKDVNARDAVNWALDRASVVNATGGSQLATAASGVIPPAITGHKDFNLWKTDGGKGDVSKAKALLAKAGMPDGFEFTLDISSTPLAQAQATAIQESLKRVGITVSLNVIDVTDFYATIQQPALQHEGVLRGWCPDWASSASTMIPPLFSGDQIREKGNYNGSMLNDPEINAKITDILAMTDTEKAATAWGDLDEQLMKLSPIAPLVFQDGIFLPGKNIAGYHPSTAMTDLAIVGLKDPSKG